MESSGHTFNASRTCSGDIVFFVLASHISFEDVDMSLIHSA